MALARTPHAKAVLLVLTFVLYCKFSFSEARVRQRAAAGGTLSKVPTESKHLHEMCLIKAVLDEII